MSNKKSKMFCRKDVRRGVHALTVDGKEIKLVDREIYPTTDQKEIKALEADPGIWEYKPEPVDNKDDKKGDTATSDAVNNETDHGESDPGN